MPHHAYIDESGTMDDQGVMSVAMIVLEGSHSAQKLYDRVMTALDSRYVQLIKQFKKNRRPVNEWPKLHYADMNLSQKRTVGGRLAQAKVTVFTAHHWHRGHKKSHEERFAIYTELVKICIRKAFEGHRELVIGVAQQGGAPKYQREFLCKLRTLPEEFKQAAGDYRKSEISLLSAVKPGIQLADFYVGTVREFTMDEKAVVPFDLIREQIVTREICNWTALESQR